MANILNRRSNPVGYLSLHEEMDFLYEINDLLSYFPEDRYKHIEVRKIEMLRDRRSFRQALCSGLSARRFFGISSSPIPSGQP